MNEIEHLILSSTYDFSTDLICCEFEKRKQKYLRLNYDALSECDIIYDLFKNDLTVFAKSECFHICSTKIKSIYFRAPVFLRSAKKQYTLDEQVSRSQWSSFIRNLIVFDSAKWMNHPVAIYKAENKLYQLDKAKKCGLHIPKTFIGNKLPNNIAAENEYVVKSLDTALFYDGKDELFTYTTKLSGKELLSSELKIAPVIVQEYLRDKTDVRVTIIGDKLYPIAITDNGNDIIGDWRKIDKDRLSYHSIELPLNIQRKIINLMNELNLEFGGMDLVISNNKYYFIEVNPTGEWGWLKYKTGLALDLEIATQLTRQ